MENLLIQYIFIYILYPILFNNDLIYLVQFVYSDNDFDDNDDDDDDI